MTVHVWPSLIRPDDVALHPQSLTTAFFSPYTRTAQTAELPGALWQLQASFPAIRPGPALDELRAFVAKLRGGAGRFVFPAYTCRYSPPAIGQPERITIIPLTIDATPITCDSTLITADATEVQLESVLTVTDCPDNVTIEGVLWLNSHRAPVALGSYVSWDGDIGRHLHLIVGFEHDRTTGECTLTVEPPMRELPDTDTDMHVHAPSAVFGMVDDNQAMLRQAGRIVQGYSIAASQRFDVQIEVPE